MQSPGEQIPNLARILYKQLIPKNSSHHLHTLTFAFVGPGDEQYSSVLLTTSQAKQTLPGTVSQGGAETQASMMWCCRNDSTLIQTTLLLMGLPDSVFLGVRFLSHKISCASMKIQEGEERQTALRTHLNPV